MISMITLVVYEKTQMEDLKIKSIPNEKWAIHFNCAIRLHGLNVHTLREWSVVASLRWIFLWVSALASEYLIV